MKQKNTPAAIAIKIKKWVEAVRELSTDNIVFAIPITRLTSIKSLCQDEVAAERFALYLAKVVIEQTQSEACPSNLSPAEWESHKMIFADASIALFCHSPRDKINVQLELQPK